MGDAWSANFAASAVVEEGFSKTVPCFPASRAFRAGLRATRVKASKAPIGGGKQK
jgi:hypothetical protein